MNINISLIGELVFYSMFVVGALSYYLGKRKTTSPKIAVLVGIVLCIIPPLNIAYLFVLMLKNDIAVESNIEPTA